MLQGTIQEITGNGTFNTDYGTMYSFHYLIDGVTYQMNHKTEVPPFQRGTVLNFEITKQADPGKGWPAKIKKVDPDFIQNQPQQPVQNGAAAQPTKKPSQNRSFALSYSKELTVSGKIEIDHMFPLAEKMLKWLEDEEEKGQPFEVVIPPHADPKVQAPPPPLQEADLLPDDESLPF